jgi:hypothetical protein
MGFLAPVTLRQTRYDENDYMPHSGRQISTGQLDFHEFTCK